jgi:hypothetical protein
MFLLHNQLLGGRLHVFINGYRSLQNTIVAFFAWPPRVRLVLDWYHLAKKFKEDPSRASRGRTIRNPPLHPLVRFLWYGMVTEAHQYLKRILAEDLKDTASIEWLEFQMIKEKTLTLVFSGEEGNFLLLRPTSKEN